STFRYGSHFWMVILKPRLSRRQPMEEAATPLPREETTPPVTKIYFGAIRVLASAGADLSLLDLRRIDVHTIMFGRSKSVNAKSRAWRIGDFYERNATFVSGAGLRAVGSAVCSVCGLCSLERRRPN